MKIFRLSNLQIGPITIIAHDVHHATNLVLRRLHEGLRHWPPVSYSIAPWEPPAEMAPDILRNFAVRHADGLAHFTEGGWEVIGDRSDD
ncbi:hypothetical protein GCM10011371_34890 [Novosphingobium marinum]|nr:hypothetical protein GCM10011371_34890 [Novosphingobium marinum]